MQRPRFYQSNLSDAVGRRKHLHEKILREYDKQGIVRAETLGMFNNF